MVVENLIKIIEFGNGFHELDPEFQRTLKTINFGDFQNSVFKIRNKHKLTYFVQSAINLRKPYSTDFMYFLRTGKIQGEILKILG